MVYPPFVDALLLGHKCCCVKSIPRPIIRTERMVETECEIDFYSLWQRHCYSSLEFW
jgi:hypothetical protein